MERESNGGAGGRMASYYVNRLEQMNGDHEVHESECSFLPPVGNRLFLGEFTNCHGALGEAKKTLLTGKRLLPLQLGMLHIIARHLTGCPGSYEIKLYT